MLLNLHEADRRHQLCYLRAINERADGLRKIFVRSALVAGNERRGAWQNLVEIEINPEKSLTEFLPKLKSNSEELNDVLKEVSKTLHDIENIEKSSDHSDLKL